MKTATTSQPAAAQPTAKARFLEIRAGRLRTEQPRSDYSHRLTPGRRFNVEPTD